MGHVEFLRSLDPDNAMRVHFEVERGEILKFTVQLECCFGDDDWVAVMRYDTAHGFAHCDSLHPYGDSAKIEMLTQNDNEALTYAIEDLATHCFEYRRRYETWMSTK